MDEGANRVDVVVVGGGFAGLTAAARAAQRGLSVTVLERGAAPDYLCNSRVSTGVYHVGSLPVTEDEQTLYDRIMTITGGAARTDLARLFAGTAASVKEWLIAEGAAFQDYHRGPGGPDMLAPGRTMSPGLDWPDRGPDRLMRRLAENLRARGGALHLGTAARRLIVEDGACTGVEAERDGATVRYAARAVVLADGGFQGSAELVSRHIAPAARLQQRNTRTGVGDGLRMAVEAGAALVGLDKFYGHVLSRDALANDRLWPYPQLDVLSATGIVVDGTGRRFADEGLGGIALVNAIARLDDPLSAWVIFDAESWEAARTEDTVPPNPALAEAGGTVLHADGVTRLAALAGLPQPALNQTVTEYNVAIMTGGFAQLSPRRTVERFAPRPVHTPPFYAIPVCAGITVTMGGIAVNDEARVLRKDGPPIPGLFAAGSTAGGMEGGPQAGYIGGLAKAFILGHRAAETIAADIGAGL